MDTMLKEPYLRPNLNNQGTLPDGTEPLAQCPDIWGAGDAPVADFQNALATAEAYASASSTSYVRGHNNYYYLRLRNGSDQPVRDMSAQLFFAPASLICWPSEWKSVPVENHAPADVTNTFDTVAAGEVGVAKAPFLLPRNLAEGDKYCLLARLFSDAYPNPMPSELSPIYIASMLTEHLLWGQQNMAAVPAGDMPQVAATFNLSVPAESFGAGNLWLLSLHTENAGQLQVEIRNSRTDDAGKQIKLEKQTVTEDMFLGRYQLNKGYSSQMSIYIYIPAGYTVTGQEHFKVDVAYIVNAEEYKQSAELNLLNPALKAKYTEALTARKESIGQMEGVIRVGEFTVCLKP